MPKAIKVLLVDDHAMFRAGIKALLEAGANINTRDGYGKTPLHSAIKTKQVSSVMLLLDSGADVNVRDRSGRKALEEAKASGLDAELIARIVAMATKKDE